MKYKLALLTLVTGLSLTGCSTVETVQDTIIETAQKVKTGHLKERFTHDISPDGLKIFTYTLIDMSRERESMTQFRKKEVERGTKSLDETRRKKLLKTVKDQKKEEITTLLEKKLAETGYCRDGYTLNNFFVKDTRSEVRGECNDRAITADREKFNTGPTTAPGANEENSGKMFSDILQ